MKVEIWSDVMCPFCYIGKRRFENALDTFDFKDKVEVEWKSFLLNPDLETNPDISIDQYLADKKGWTLDYAQKLNQQVTAMAADVGLTYNFDKAKVANSFKAHRFGHFAKKHHKGIEAEEALFKAYFTDGENIDDDSTLVELGQQIGLDATEIEQMLQLNTYAEEVKQDLLMAQNYGIQGVPFFVFDDKYAISGTQAPQVFEQTIAKAFAEWQQNNSKGQLETIEGATCSPDADC
jgi:predicted DsbA family dithiol-disulfide isomerase